MTALDLITKIRFLIDDDTEPTAPELVTLINEARNILADEAGLFKDEFSRSSQVNVYKYTLPAAALRVADIKFSRGTEVIDVVPITEKEFKEADLTNLSDAHKNYYLDGRVLNFTPRLSQGAGTTALNGAISDSATVISVDSLSNFPSVGKIIIDSEVIYYSGKSSSDGGDSTTLSGNHSASVSTITVASTSGFPSSGKILIDSEIISYTGTTSTTFTGCSRGADGTTAATHTSGATVADTFNVLTGCTRAQESTTAASHLDDATVTERDIVVSYYKHPTALNYTATGTNDTVDPQFEYNSGMAIAYYCAWQAMLKDCDDITPGGTDRQAQRFEAYWLREKGKFVSRLNSDRYQTIREV